MEVTPRGTQKHDPFVEEPVGERGCFASFVLISGVISPRIDVLSGHLGASPAARPVTERRSRAAMVAAATAAGMAGGVLAPRHGKVSPWCSLFRMLFFEKTT